MKRRFIGILLAIVLAVLGTAAVLAYVRAARDQVAQGQEAVTVLIAKERVPAGTSGARIRDSDLVQEVVMPALSVPEDALGTVPADLDSLVVTSDLQPRQLLLRGMFGPATKLSGGLNMPEQMLAVSVQIDADQQVAGFVRPGSRIAIFDTFTLYDERYKKATGEDNRSTRLLLPRVEVLAIGAYGAGGVTSTDTEDSSGDGDGNASRAQSALLLTVAVNQTDAERLIHATRTGQLYLALLTDTSEVKPGVGVDNATLFE